MNSQLVERLSFVPGAVPIDTNGAAVTGDYVCLKYHRRLAIVIQQGAWAGGTPAVTLKQASDVAGTGEKALSFTVKFAGVALTTDTLTRATVTSDTFNLPATANTFTIVECHAQDLDVNNGFCYVRVAIASPGSNADLISVLYILGDPLFESKPETHPSVIV